MRSEWNNGGNVIVISNSTKKTYLGFSDRHAGPMTRDRTRDGGYPRLPRNQLRFQEIETLVI